MLLFYDCRERAEKEHMMARAERELMESRLASITAERWADPHRCVAMSCHVAERNLTALCLDQASCA